MNMTIADLISLASDIGVIALLILILYGGRKRWWVWGWLYDDKIKETEEWKFIAIRSTNLADILKERKP